MAERGYSENIIKLLNLLIPVLGIIWAIVPVSGDLALLIPSIVAFFALLTARSHELFRKRTHIGKFKGRFMDYLIRKNALIQNAILAVFIGSSGLFLLGILKASQAIGAFVLLGAIDTILFAPIIYFFFRRPGIQKTLSRSFRDNSESARHVDALASKFGMKSPELRIIASGRSNHANAFSWSLPRGKSYIFANEELFAVLDKDEVGGIFTHELGHIKSRHSEKSFLLSSLIPLLWLNLMALPFALFTRFPAFLLAASELVVAILYVYYRRGWVSRRFEKQADIFASRNYDKEVYISSLRKLSEYGGLETHGKERNFTSHDAFEEREKLIRGA